MKIKKTIYFFTLFFVLTGCFNWIKEEKTENFKIEKDGYDTLYIYSINGDIDINSGEADSVNVEVKETAYGMTHSEAKTKLEKINIKREKTGNTYKIIYEGPETNAGASFILNDVSEKYIKIENTNGRITADTIKGGTVENTNGNIVLLKSTGSINFITTNGSMTIKDFSGDNLITEATNGGYNITINGKEENEEIRIASGTITTTNGNITITLSKKLSVEIDFNTTNGNITIEGASFEKNSGQYARLKLNEGKNHMSIETTNGNIEVIVK